MRLYVAAILIVLTAGCEATDSVRLVQLQQEQETLQREATRMRRELSEATARIERLEGALEEVEVEQRLSELSPEIDSKPRKVDPHDLPMAGFDVAGRLEVAQEDRLTKAQVTQILGKYLEAMKSCVEQQNQRDASVGGTMKVKFIIENSGKVNQVEVLTQEHLKTYVAGCVSFVIKSARFPAFKGEPFVVHVLPLKLRGGTVELMSGAGKPSRSSTIDMGNTIGCKKGIKEDKQRALVLSGLAVEAFKSKHFRKAEKLFEEAICFHPKNCELYRKLGTVNAMSGQKQEAYRAYKKYVNLCPEGKYAPRIREIIQEYDRH